MPATSDAFRASVGGRWAIRRSPASGRALPPVRRRVDRPRRVIAVSLALIAVFGCGLMLSGYVPFSLSMRSTMELALRDNDEFSQTRIGDVLFATSYGNACRKVHFHNIDGRFGPDLRVRCDTGLPDDQTASIRRSGNSSSRLMSIRDAFVHR